MKAATRQSEPQHTGEYCMRMPPLPAPKRVFVSRRAALRIYVYVCETGARVAGQVQVAWGKGEGEGWLKERSSGMDSLQALRGVRQGCLHGGLGLVVGQCRARGLPGLSPALDLHMLQPLHGGELGLQAGRHGDQDLRGALLGVAHQKHRRGGRTLLVQHFLGLIQGLSLATQLGLHVVQQTHHNLRGLPGLLRHLLPSLGAQFLHPLLQVLLLLAKHIDSLLVALPQCRFPQQGDHAVIHALAQHPELPELLIRGPFALDDGIQLGIKGIGLRDGLTGGIPSVHHHTSGVAAEALLRDDGGELGQAKVGQVGAPAEFHAVVPQLLLPRALQHRAHLHPHGDHPDLRRVLLPEHRAQRDDAEGLLLGALLSVHLEVLRDLLVDDLLHPLQLLVGELLVP
eukprot:RCo048553